MMCRTIFAVLAITLLPQPCSAEKPKTDQERIQGKWRVTSMRVRGTDVSIADLGNLGYTFTNRKLTIVGPGQKGVCELEFHTNRNPKQLDMKAIEGTGAEKLAYAIYRLKDGILTLCIGEKRPSAFSGDGEAGLFVLERVKKSN